MEENSENAYKLGDWYQSRAFNVYFLPPLTKALNRAVNPLSQLLINSLESRYCSTICCAGTCRIWCITSACQREIVDGISLANWDWTRQWRKKTRLFQEHPLNWGIDYLILSLNWIINGFWRMDCNWDVMWASRKREGCAGPFNSWHLLQGCNSPPGDHRWICPPILAAIVTKILCRRRSL